MLWEDRNQLLKPGYLEMETGYCRLPNGQIYIAVLTRMPHCKAKWVNLILNPDQVYPENFRDLSDHNLFLERKLKQKLDDRIRQQTIGRKPVIGMLLHYRIEQDDPYQIFNPLELNKSNVAVAVCARSYLPDGSLDSRIIHLIRDTEYGCETRSRYWFHDCTEESAREKLEQYVSGTGSLGDSMREIIEEWQINNRGALVSCKFCRSEEVIKNGLRSGTQYWLCKNCGRGFVDNDCLPKMRYPFDVVGRAFLEYCSGKPLTEICKNIEKEYTLLPSRSTVLGWIRKLSNTPL